MKIDDEKDQTLRIAFDFDGVLADDTSERVMQSSDLDHNYGSEVSTELVAIQTFSRT